MVTYCPGSATGSPAGMSRSEAEAYLAQDTRHLEKMIEADSITGPFFYPHIGRKAGCPKCAPTIPNPWSDKS
jgi:hypothetical protein